MRITPQLARIIEGTGEPENNTYVRFFREHPNSIEPINADDFERSNSILLAIELIQEILAFESLNVRVIICPYFLKIEYRFRFYFLPQEVGLTQQIDRISLVGTRGPTLHRKIRIFLLNSLHNARKNFSQFWVAFPKTNNINLVLFSLGDILRFEADSFTVYTGSSGIYSSWLDDSVRTAQTTERTFDIELTDISNRFILTSRHFLQVRKLEIYARCRELRSRIDPIPLPFF